MKYVCIVLCCCLLAVGCGNTPTPAIQQDSVLVEVQRSYDGCDLDDRPCLTAKAAANSSYYVYGKSQQITRPEWTSLFPQTKFYLVPANLVTVERPSPRNLILAFYKDQWYQADTFYELLEAHGIRVTDDNRELIVKAFISMTLANYLDQDVEFSDWVKGDWPAHAGRRFDYSITAWTKIQGLRTKWFFAFENEKLWLAESMESEYHIGPYIDVSLEVLPLPGGRQYWFNKN
jgi:hypothetical protein